MHYTMSDRFDFVVRRETIESTLRVSIRMLSPDTKRYFMWTNACDQLQCPRSKLRSNRAKSFMESTLNFAVDRAQYDAPRESASMTSYWGISNRIDPQCTPKGRRSTATLTVKSVNCESGNRGMCIYRDSATSTVVLVKEVEVNKYEYN